MAIPHISVTPDGHFFQDENGAPFFFLSDTAWVLFNKLTEEEIRVLFENRARKGFNIIQSVVFRDLFTPNSPNASGITPFASEEAMWKVEMNPLWIDWVRRVLGIAAEYGLTMALLPTWGDKWNEHSNSAGPVIMNRESARAYGRFLSDALADCSNLLWILGGDSPIQTQAHADIVHAIAAGLREGGGGGDRLMTFYPSHNGASDIFHASDWLDFNVIQSGHTRPNIADYLYLERLYRLQPPKPCLNFEANFENCPMFLMMKQPEYPEQEPIFSAYDVRKCLYRSVLAGAAGFSYGCEPIRQLWREGDRVHAYPRYRMPATWRESLDTPASDQMRHLKQWLSERRYFTREPAQELFVPIRSFRGVGMDYTVPENRDPAAHIRIARCREGSYIMAYIPVRQAIQLNVSQLAPRFQVTLYDPESGGTTGRFTCENRGHFTVVPHRDLDTFLVLDSLD